MSRNALSRRRACPCLSFLHKHVDDDICCIIFSSVASVIGSYGLVMCVWCVFIWRREKTKIYITILLFIHSSLKRLGSIIFSTRLKSLLFLFFIYSFSYPDDHCSGLIIKLSALVKFNQHFNVYVEDTKSRLSPATSTQILPRNSIIIRAKWL